MHRTTNRTKKARWMPYDYHSYWYGRHMGEMGDIQTYVKAVNRKAVKFKGFKLCVWHMIETLQHNKIAHNCWAAADNYRPASLTATNSNMTYLKPSVKDFKTKMHHLGVRVGEDCTKLLKTRAAHPPTGAFSFACH